ncbi:MAG: hypothetical protein CBB87_01825 [Micavibrio sp. TMED27]|nr:hypothetical protein [Micavibrio sp.]OUT92501.1 MAG: hypothetical protein CBB87_01825 [Micavibrio sp. TMED27]|tara:strand:- start:1365 stop:1574 length:210 start_codon:yes stop_codon:yes gene_type:complete
MGKLSIAVWIMTATVLMGVFVLAILLTPSLEQNQMDYILYAAIAGAIVAIPITSVLTYKIQHLFDEKSA